MKGWSKRSYTLKNYNIRINTDNCKLFLQWVRYLGHEVDKNDYHYRQSSSHKAIVESGQLNSTESLFGVNFYSTLLPKLDMVQEPLHGLLRRETAWHWSHQSHGALRASKEILTNESALELYTVKKKKKEIWRMCDAMEYILGGCWFIPCSGWKGDANCICVTVTVTYWMQLWPGKKKRNNLSALRMVWKNFTTTCMVELLMYQQTMNP